MQRDQRRLLFLSSLGGILEFYDFIIYALFASYISNAFFPSSNSLASLMITFATFAIGYLVRPLGGIIFGHFGDRIGRKTTFTISILMMAIATFSIGLMPTYEKIGITASFLMIGLRIVQGLSVGGEIPGAITYVSESLPQQKGLSCGIIFCALTMGIVLGSLVQALVVNIFSDAQMQIIGWRIPFIVGGIFGLLSYFLRRELHESAQFLAIENKIEKFPLITVLKQQFGYVIAGAFIIALCAAIVTLLFLFIPAYFAKVLHLPATAYIWQRTTAIALGSCSCIFFGLLADKFDTKNLILILGLLSGLLAYPIFAIYAYYTHLYALAFILSAFLTGFSAGVIPVLFSEIFPTHIRYSGIAISYNLGFAVFGGLTPFISLSLIYYTHSITIPALYLVLVSLAAIISVLYVKSSKSQAVDNAIQMVNEVL